MRRIIVCAWRSVCAGGVCLLLACAFDGAAEALPRAEVIVARAEAPAARFEAEVASTARDRVRGLMWRRTLPAGTGMLFDFGAPQRVAMWMQDTYLALDMLFIAADGRIVEIRPHRAPLSKDIEHCAHAVRYVLEINAGAAERAGLRPGDAVTIRALP